ncbi:MAG: SUMF1/EgtB/PvdO family nonheme iron enzyme [bacterium]|nr:SUMF1/EgtB/PvdO family nonheme iron enzyme [bacterium]
MRPNMIRSILAFLTFASLMCVADMMLSGEYCVIDISKGPTASIYPVSVFTGSQPVGDDYKTSKILLRKIPAGSFVMGSPPSEGGHSDETQHSVALTNDFYIGIYEITQGQYSNVMGSNPSYFPLGTNATKRPVEQLSWNTIRDGNWPNGTPSNNSFIGKLCSKANLPCDLPTEAQWEYACRAGTIGARNQDTNMNYLGRYDANGGNNYEIDPTNGGTAAVGCYMPNAWGLYDMHGNVGEWCLDWYANYGGDATNPPGPSLPTSDRVYRGGGWSSSSGDCRSALRDRASLDWSSRSIGLRIALTIDLNKLPPNTPGNVEASKGTFTNSVRIEWMAVSMATKYSIYRNSINSTNTSLLIVGELNSNAYDDATATPLQPYYYWVRAGNNNGWSDFSESDIGYAGQSIAIPTFSPTSLDFSSNINARFVSLGNDGTAPYTYNANVISGGTWLSVNPASDLVSNLTIVLAASVSRSGLKDGSYTGAIMVTTSAGTSVVVSAQMIVAGNAVIAEANGPYFVDQGLPIALTALGSQGQILRYRWEVGLDYISAYSNSYFNLTYTNTLIPQMMDVVLTVRDTNSPPNTGSDSTTLTIRNVPPTLDLAGPYQASTTNPVDFTTVVNDPGLLDTHVFRWDFNGDGSWDTDWLTSNSISHLYLAGGSYIVQCEVKDNYGGVGADTASVLIEMLNVPPVAEALISGTALAETNLPGLGYSVTLNGLGSYDPDSKPLTNLYFDWREDVNNPQKPVIPEAILHDKIVSTLPLNEMGQYKFHLVVCDGEYNSQPATVTVHVPGWKGEVISEGYMAKIPLWGVQAVVTNSYNHQLKTARSDAQGIFLADAGPGYQIAQLTRHSVEPSTMPISIGADGSFMENIRFTPNFYIYAGQIVTGTPDNFVGLYQANVQLLIGNGLSSKTDAMGNFAFDTVPETWPVDGVPYIVRIQKTGFRSELKDDIRLNRNRNSETLVMTPSPDRVAVGGTIRSEKSGVAVESVILDFGNGWTATSDIAGVFGPVSVPPGDYVLKLRKQGFTDTIQFLTGLANDTTNLDFVIQGGEVSMYGEILDGNGFVVTNATLNLEGVPKARSQEIERATGAGYYDLTVAKGTRRYHVSAPGFESHAVTVSNVNDNTKLNVILIPEPVGILLVASLALILRRR